MAVDASADEAPIGQRSGPKETATRFLKISRALNTGGNKKKDVTNTEAHVPIPAHSEGSAPKEAKVPPNNRGKRSSPQRSSEEAKADLSAPDAEYKEPAVMTELEGNHSDASPVKKQRLDPQGN